MHATKDQPVVIENRFLLTSLHYQGSHSNYYNAVDSQENYKSILVQIITDSHCICKLLRRLLAFSEANDKLNEKNNRYSKALPIPRIYQLGNLPVSEITYHYVVWQKTGPSLKLCFNLMKQKLSIKTIALIALKMITALQQIHSQNVLHRCLKLSCIMTTNRQDLLLTNLDQYSEFLNKEGKISNRSKSTPIKLHKFSSLGQHLQQIPSPRDDLESLGYIILYLLTKGTLPTKSQAKDYNVRDKFYMEFKRNLLPEKVLKDFPEPFFHYFYNVLKLGIKEIPNYELLKQPFQQLLGKSEGDIKFDWTEIIQIQKDLSVSSDLQVREQAKTAQNIIIHSSLHELEKDLQSAPISPKRKELRNMTIEKLKFTLAPILEKNESIATKNHYYESNTASPKFRDEVDNLMVDLCQQDSSSGEVSPKKDDEPIIDQLPKFQQHQHSIF